MPSKRLVDILDDMNLKENEVLNKLGRLLRLISSTNPSNLFKSPLLGSKSKFEMSIFFPFLFILLIFYT